MCLILFSYRRHPAYPLIIAANRDEFYERPTAPASFWDDQPDILAGRDLRDGGTWLGITRSGRMAAITNYRDPRILKDNAPSRGELVSGFLLGDATPDEYIQGIKSHADRYNGFNLLMGDGKGLFHFSNKTGVFSEILPGTHGISNHLLDTPWPKVERGRSRLADVLSGREPSPNELFDILADTSHPDDRELPDTGIGIEWERLLSSVFIRSDIYGTRSSTVLLVDHEGTVRFIERSFTAGPVPFETVQFELRIPGGAYAP